MMIPAVISGFLLTADHQKIAYAHYNAGHKEVIVIAPGFFNSKESILLKALKEALLEDYDVIMFDFRGHGKSQGVFFWMSREALDLEAVLDYAAAQYAKVGLIGFSLGGATSINVLSKSDKADSLVVISAPSAFEKVDFRFWKLDLENDIVYNLGKGGKGKGVRPGPFWLKKIKPVDVIENVKAPILFIHGDKDWVVDHKHSVKLFEKTKSRKELKIIKNGPHAEYLMRKNSKELLDSIKEWFRKTL